MHGLVKAVNEASAKGQRIPLRIKTSNRYKHWITKEDLRLCMVCEENHGKIWPITDVSDPAPPIHPNCRCEIEQMKAIVAGTATINETDGADWKLLVEGKLPDYYVTKDEAESCGWKRRKWPCNFVPGKMITWGHYNNDDGHLPSAPGREWNEADINYTTGRRNNQRIVWSSDGLVFVTYDHYKTFYEITGG